MNAHIYSSAALNKSAGSLLSSSSSGPEESNLTLSGFEGPEKLIEIWFAPAPESSPHHANSNSHNRSSHRHASKHADSSAAALPTSVLDAAEHPNSTSDEDASEASLSDCEKPAHHYASPSVHDSEGHWKFRRTGLRTVSRPVWEDMLQIVKCQVLSVIKNEYADAFLLSESSMFVYPNRIVLKTCGTTTLLLAIPRILEIAREMCDMAEVQAVFYSRKAFLFPERQAWPHGKWGDEVAFLDNIFPDDQFDTSGYVVGKINGDHWCLYVATPCGMDMDGNPIKSLEASSDIPAVAAGLASGHAASAAVPASADAHGIEDDEDDVTLEILMTNLDPEAMKVFWRTEEEKAAADKIQEAAADGAAPAAPVNKHTLKYRMKSPEHRVFTQTGISDVYPDSQVDDFVFNPCGYSLNGLLGPYYYTIHVTPEDICSYASFETTVPVKMFKPKVAREGVEYEYDSFNDVIEKVVQRFKPGRFSTTLFVRHSAANKVGQGRTHLLDGAIKGFRRRDRIVHSLGQWDLIFCHFDQSQTVASAAKAKVAAASAAGVDADARAPLLSHLATRPATLPHGVLSPPSLSSIHFFHPHVLAVAHTTRGSIKLLLAFNFFAISDPMALQTHPNSPEGPEGPDSRAGPSGSAGRADGAASAAIARPWSPASIRLLSLAPEEIWRHIFTASPAMLAMPRMRSHRSHSHSPSQSQFVEDTDLHLMAKVCRLFRLFATDSVLWRRLLHHRNPSRLSSRLFSVPQRPSRADLATRGILRAGAGSPEMLVRHLAEGRYVGGPAALRAFEAAAVVRKSMRVRRLDRLLRARPDYADLMDRGIIPAEASHRRRRSSGGGGSGGSGHASDSDDGMHTTSANLLPRIVSLRHAIRRDQLKRSLQARKSLDDLESMGISKRHAVTATSGSMLPAQIALDKRFTQMQLRRQLNRRPTVEALQSRGVLLSDAFSVPLISPGHASDTVAVESGVSLPSPHSSLPAL
ncbi:S-adenosylmethionine decarboxylase [Entophlyctis helioformis]|nr:S-adenosylmethionine decarboxylase [Entophlyctis helioformis]